MEKNSLFSPSTSEQLNTCENEHETCACGHTNSRTHDSSAESDGCNCDYDHSHDHGNKASNPHSHSGCACCDEDEDDDDGHDHDHGEAPSWVLWARLGAAAVLTAAGIFFEDSGWVSYCFFIPAWLLAGYDIAWNMLKNIAKGQIFDENLLMTVASIGALSIGEAFEGVAVMLLYQIGEWFQHRAVLRSRRNIRGMLDLRPETANVLNGDEISVTLTGNVPVGATVLVRAGERVPLDGVVVSGSADFDTASMTGEAVPRAVSEGAELLAGFISLNGAVRLRVTRPASESAAARVEKLLSETSKNKAPAEEFVRKFAKKYTPAVVFSAIGIAVLPPVFGAGSFSDWLYRALTFLVVSCPCALVLSVPLSFFGGVGGAAKRGIMVKGGSVLELLARAETVAFDKTGTLTTGKFTVTDISTAPGVSRTELLSAAVTAERGSTHPIAEAVLAAAQNFAEISADSADNSPQNAAQTLPESAEKVEEIAGFGVRATLKNGDVIFAGNAAFMARGDLQFLTYSGAGSVVHVAKNAKYLGMIVVSDTPKPGAAETAKSLQSLGVSRVSMLTGDRRASAEAMAKNLGITDVHAELLPDGKMDVMRKLMAEAPPKTTSAFVGDGINDAPVLALADVGIAMADGGTRLAVEAADAVILSGSPLKIAEAVKIAKKTTKIVRQNVVFALAVKAAVLVLAAFGLAPMWAAVVADVGVALLAVLNALRTLRA